VKSLIEVLEKNEVAYLLSLKDDENSQQEVYKIFSKKDWINLESQKMRVFTL